MKMPPARSIVATLTAVLIAAPFLLMYARWRSIWIYPGLLFLAVATAWRILWYPRTGYTVLIGAGAGVLAGVLLGALLTGPVGSLLKTLKLRPDLLRMVLMFHGAWIGLLLGLFAGYYWHLRQLLSRQAVPVSLPAPAPNP